MKSKNNFDSKHFLKTSYIFGRLSPILGSHKDDSIEPQLTYRKRNNAVIRRTRRKIFKSFSPVLKPFATIVRSFLTNMLVTEIQYLHLKQDMHHEKVMFELKAIREEIRGRRE